jgi:hypothetical protein
MSIPGHSPEKVSLSAGSVAEGRRSGAFGPDGRELPVGFLCLAWGVLVGIGILGRLCAGALFANRFVAASVPVIALAASNLALPGGGSYGSWTMAAIIYAAFTWPVLMGSLVRRSHVWGALGGALAGSLVFYLATNFAHWWLTADYPHTARGLVECYVAALPFYRWTPVGDLVWSLGLTSGLAFVPALARRFRGVEVA